MCLERRRDRERLGAKLSLQDAFVATSCAALGIRLRIGLIFAAEHSASERAVGHYAQAVVRAGGDDFGFDQSGDGAVRGLAHDGLGDAHAACRLDHARDAPASEIRNAVVADLAVVDQACKRRQGLLNRRGFVILVHVIDVDPVGAQPTQAVFHLVHDPAARQALIIGLVANRIGHLGRQHPARAILGDQPTDDALGFALGVVVGGVDGVQARVAGHGDDLARVRLVGLVAEHHRAQPEARHPQAALAEASVFGFGFCHGHQSFSGLLFRRLDYRSAARRTPPPAALFRGPDQGNPASLDPAILL